MCYFLFFKPCCLYKFSSPSTRICTRLLWSDTQLLNPKTNIQTKIQLTALHDRSCRPRSPQPPGTALHGGSRVDWPGLPCSRKAACRPAASPPPLQNGTAPRRRRDWDGEWSQRRGKKHHKLWRAGKQRCFLQSLEWIVWVTLWTSV